MSAPTACASHDELLPWHQQAWQSLQRRRERGTLPHALLLAGPAGLGKRRFARRFAQGLLCEHSRQGEPCGHCRACGWFVAGSHPDVVRVGLETRRDGSLRPELVVDQIRELGRRLALCSQLGGWQLALLDPADTMNAAAANALLKTLEEPSEQTLILLLADLPWRLPQTIRSRCQRIDFALPAPPTALAWLEREAVEAPAAALQAAAGNPGLARRWAGDGQLALREEVRRDLLALASGQGELAEVLRRWLEGPLESRLWFAAQAGADESKARATAAPAPFGTPLGEEALLDWYVQANRIREALRGPLRADLLLLSWLAAWTK